MDMKTKNLIESNFDLIDLYVDTQQALIESQREQIKTLNDLNTAFVALVSISASDSEIIPDFVFDWMDELSGVAMEDDWDDECEKAHLH